MRQLVQMFADADVALSTNKTVVRMCVRLLLTLEPETWDLTNICSALHVTTKLAAQII